MSFAFFRGEDAFPRGQFRVPPPFLRNYAKTGFRHLEDEQNTHSQPLNSGLDGTIQGRSLGKINNPSPYSNPGNTKASVELRNPKLKQLAPVPEKIDKPVGVERTDMNRNQLVDLQRSIQNRLTGPALESIDLYPLAGMRCIGQKMSLTDSQQNPQKRESIPEEAPRDSLVCEQVVSNGTTTGTGNSSNAVSLNKLYSCLKKMKCRKNDVGQYEDLATISMNDREPAGFSRTYFQRVFASNNAKHTAQTRSEQEEIFLLLGGKSKLVRFQINPEGLNLLEKEWRVELKSRDSIFCNSDEEGLQLLQRFRARFRLGNQRKTPSLPIPWARHVVHKGRNQSPEEKERLEEEETGRKLSIHVYLPNAGWEEQRNSTPATPIFSPSRLTQVRR